MASSLCHAFAGTKRFRLERIVRHAALLVAVAAEAVVEQPCGLQCLVAES